MPIEEEIFLASKRVRIPLLYVEEIVHELVVRLGRLLMLSPHMDMRRPLLQLLCSILLKMVMVMVSLCACMLMLRLLTYSDGMADLGLLVLVVAIKGNRHRLGGIAATWVH